MNRIGNVQLQGACAWKGGRKKECESQKGIGLVIGGQKKPVSGHCGTLRKGDLAGGGHSVLGRG